MDLVLRLSGRIVSRSHQNTIIAELDHNLIYSRCLPYRTEEALERFIVVSNGDNFFGQIPIGGGKESIDIGIKESDTKFVFVELKPWESQNSPLYAIIEILKNLVEYRVILERHLADVPRWSEVELVVLAPCQYYQKWKLDNEPKKRI
jgi:hypothetical protein